MARSPSEQPKFVKTITRALEVSRRAGEFRQSGRGDEAPADHAVPAIPDHGLSRRHGPLRRVEDDLGAAILERAHGRGRRLVTVPDLRLDADRRLWRRA